MSFRPLGDRVLVRRVEEEAKTKGGIIIPDTAKEKPQEGEVLAVGPGGRDNGAPGLRPHYHPNYYGAFVLDPDGVNIEAVCHAPA